MIVPVVSNNVQAIETIETTRTIETTSITWIELSSIRTIGTIVENLKRSYLWKRSQTTETNETIKAIPENITVILVIGGKCGLDASEV